MKKQFISGSVLLASIGSIAAQGLYDIAPNIDAQESLPIKWTAGFNVGWDDNFAALSGQDESIAFAHAYIGASLVNITPQTTWDVYANVGARVNIDAPSNIGDDVDPQFRLGFNWAHRVSERLRFSSRNHVGYETEPDFDTGFGGDSAAGQYFVYSSDNAVGYRWTERLATYTGVRFNGIIFEEDFFEDNDRFIYGFYNNFRYSLNQQTVLTLGYRYSRTSTEGSAGDSTNQFITGGVEHRFSPTSVLTLRAGTQIRDVDGGDSSTNPFIEGALRTQLSERFSIRSFVRYSVEDFGSSFEGFTFDTNRALRFGVTGNYQVSPKLSVHGGVNYIRTEFEDGRSVVGGPDPSDFDQDVINLNAGFSYAIRNGLFLTGNYNWSESDSDEGFRSFNRNRASLGVRVDF